MYMMDKVCGIWLQDADRKEMVWNQAGEIDENEYG